MATTMCDITQEYVVPSGVTAIRIEAESGKFRGGKVVAA